MVDEKTAVHIHEDDIELYLRGRVKPERLSSVEAHLLECELCQAHLSDCVGPKLALPSSEGADSGAGQKRAEERFNTEGEGTLQELDPLSMESYKIRIVNVSKSGLGIVSAKPLLPGTIVKIRIKGSVELGNVRYCAALDDGAYRLGVRLNGEG
jgi:hypothetical protein